MSKFVRLSHHYRYDPLVVWEIATDFDCLAEAMKGLIAFEGLPEGGLHKGQIIDVNVSLFGLLPAQPYRMELLEFDPAAMTFLSDERGLGVECWRHRMTVSPTATGCTLTDEIEIEAGWRTPVVALWARYIYARRHKPRLAMLARHSSV